jgi:hypothetical protein
MRVTGLHQTAQGLPDQTRDEEADYPLRDPVIRDVARLKWDLWQGNVAKALQVLQAIEMDLAAAVAMSRHATARQRLQAVEEFHTYLANHPRGIPHDGARDRHGERLSTGGVASTVNQVLSKRCCTTPQMA